MKETKNGCKPRPFDFDDIYKNWIVWTSQASFLRWDVIGAFSKFSNLPWYREDKICPQLKGLAQYFPQSSFLLDINFISIWLFAQREPKFNKDTGRPFRPKWQLPRYYGFRERHEGCSEKEFNGWFPWVEAFFQRDFSWRKVIVTTDSSVPLTVQVAYHGATVSPRTISAAKISLVTRRHFHVDNLELRENGIVFKDERNQIW